MLGNNPLVASSRFNSSMALLVVSAEFAFSIRRRRMRTVGSLSLIAHRRTNTCASKKELIRTGHAKLGKFASNRLAFRTSLISLHFIVDLMKTTGTIRGIDERTSPPIHF
jgi:hypothetical protein